MPIAIISGRPTTPPHEVIKEALLAAARSPCQKSKRGAVLFNPFTGQMTQSAFNSRPDMQCDSRCRPPDLEVDGPNIATRCSMLCVHAEARALRFALVNSERSRFVADGDFFFDITQLELVHVKLQNGELVPSGPPSCWQCAKEIADHCIFGVWLYEVGKLNPTAEWNFYPTVDFYARTLKHAVLSG